MPRLAVALAAWAALLACASSPAPAPECAAPRGAPLLWRADGGPGGGSLFLFGSVHFGNPQTLDFDGALGRAWQGSEELVVEIDLTRVTAQDYADAVVEYGTLREGQSLEQRLAPETWKRLVEELAAHGLQASAFAPFKPWLAAIQLSVLQIQGAGLDPRYGVDHQLINRASGRKPIVELEGLDQQFAMLDSLEPELQEAMLVEVLDQAEQVEGESARIVDSWRRGDEQALLEIFFGDMQKNPEFAALYEKVYFERNEAMSRRLAELARDGRTRLAVVGAGHMLGPRGIPSLLAELGFRVECVR